MTSDTYTSTVVDADTHFWQPIRIWEQFIDERWKQPVTEFWAARDEISRTSTRAQEHKADSSGRVYADTGDDIAQRLEFMDQEGVDIQVIFPTSAGRALRIPDPDVSAAACRAVNRWNAEFASAAPMRFKPTMLLPMWHPEQALNELRYAHEKLGFRTAFVAPTPSPRRRWSDPELDPLWREMENRRVVACLHEFSQLAAYDVGVARPVYEDFYEMMYYCHHTVEMQLALMDLIVGGTMERFPQLRFGFVEAHTAWLPGWLAQMDSLGSWLTTHKIGNKGERHQSLLPTEFFRRQCFLASFPDDAWINETIGYVGEDNVVICSDYPHPGTAHNMVATFEKSYPDMAPPVRAKLLGENAVRIFGWDEV